MVVSDEVLEKLKSEEEVPGCELSELVSGMGLAFALALHLWRSVAVVLALGLA